MIRNLSSASKWIKSFLVNKNHQMGGSMLWGLDVCTSVFLNVTLSLITTSAEIIILRLEKPHSASAHLFYPVWVPLSPALADVHLCGVDTAWLWEAAGDRSVFLGQITLFLQHALSAPVLLTQYDAVFLFSGAMFHKRLMQSDWHQIWFCYQQQNSA